jgi:hypothetical protein
MHCILINSEPQECLASRFPVHRSLARTTLGTKSQYPPFQPLFTPYSLHTYFSGFPMSAESGPTFLNLCTAPFRKSSIEMTRYIPHPSILCAHQMCSLLFDETDHESITPKQSRLYFSFHAPLRRHYRPSERLAPSALLRASAHIISAAFFHKSGPKNHKS